MRRLDLLVAAWVVLWLVVAGFVVHDVLGLRDLAEPAVSASRALEDTERALAEIDRVPLLGEALSLGELRASIAETARETRAEALESRREVGRLAWLLGVVTALVPTVPVVAFVIARRRDERAAA